MNLKKFVVATALGATVLTAVPALVAPHEAAASACDTLSECGNGPGDDGGDWGGGDTGGGDTGGGDTGYGDAGGGGEAAIEFSEGSAGDSVAGIPTVVITASAYAYPALPADPGIPSVEWNSGGGNGGASSGSGSGDSAYPVRPMSEKTNLRQNCIKNNGSVPLKLTQASKYQTSYKVSANISATAAQALTASLGVEINKSFEKNLSFEVTINPGESWALEVEYQTVEWAITTTSWTGKSTTEFVNVTQPTDTVTAVRCD